MSIQQMSYACSATASRSDQEKKAALSGSASFNAREEKHNFPPDVCS
jgi:hypothetical protein